MQGVENTYISLSLEIDISFRHISDENGHACNKM